MNIDESSGSVMHTHRHFVEDGFALFEQPVFNSGLISQALDSAKQVMKGHYSRGCAPWAVLDANNSARVQRIAQIHIASDTLHQLVTSPILGQLAAEVSQANRVKIWGTQLYYKPQHSGVGGVVGYHRDSEHMPFFTCGAMTAWIPLNRFEPESGLLQFVAGSHHWPRQNPFSGAEHQSFLQQQEHLRVFYHALPWQETPSVLQPGSISFHHQDVLHGSPENQSDTPRWALGVGLLVDDYQINPQQNDYGFAKVLNNEFYCPTIYSRDTC